MSEKGTKDGVAAVAACYQGDVSGELLVDIGSGPTLYQVLSGCEVFSRVILTDFLEVNRQELRSWLRDEGDCALDWTPCLQPVCKLEPLAWTEKAARLHLVVSDILPVDVHHPQPLTPDALPSAGADCLMSCFCLESTSHDFHDLAAFTRALGHIQTLLRPSGHLLLIGALGESYYFGGLEVKIPVVPLNEAQVCVSLKENGFTLIRLEVYTLPPDMRVGVDDVAGVFFVKEGVKRYTMHYN